MQTLRLAALALVLAACGGTAIDVPSVEDFGDELAAIEAAAAVAQPAASTPAPSDAPAPAVEPEPAPSPMEGDDEQADDEAVDPEPLYELPSPRTRDDAEPAPEPRAPGWIDIIAPEPAPEPEPTPEPEPDLIEGGDICTADEQCVDGLSCAAVSCILPDGSGYYEHCGERRCAYTGD